MDQPPPAHAPWMLPLRMAAPSAAWPFLVMLAVVLDNAPHDGLQGVYEALREMQEEARLLGFERNERELRALADLVGRERDWRSPTLSLPRRA